MPAADSSLVRAFTKRLSTHVVSRPPPPPTTQEALQRRQAALRQMGLIPALTLSEQEAELDRMSAPSPVSRGSCEISHSEADRIKNEWVAKNSNNDKERMASFKFGGNLDPVTIPLPPSPPLTPLSGHFNDIGPDCSFTMTTSSSSPNAASPTFTINTTPPTVPTSSVSFGVISEKHPTLVQSQPHSPISPEFHRPESPHSSSHSHLHPPRADSPLGIPIHIPFRSRSPSLAGSESKSTRSRSKSRARSKSPLRFFVRGGADKEECEPPLSPARSDLPPPPPILTTTDAKEEEDQVKLPTPADTPTSPLDQTPPAPQRKKTVFGRFKRANSFLPSFTEQKETDSQTQSPSRSKSLFITVRKTVFGSGANASAGTGPPGTKITGSLKVSTNEKTVPLAPSLPSLPFLPTISTSTNPSSVDLLSPSSACKDESIFDSTTPTPNPAATRTPTPTQDAEPKPDSVGVEVKVEENDDPLPSDPSGSTAERESQPQEGQKQDKGKAELPPSPTSLVGESKVQESETGHERERARSPSSGAHTSSSGHSGTTGTSTSTPTASGKRTGKGIGLSLILNRERKSSSPLPSSPPSSPFSYRSPTSPTLSSSNSLRMRGRLGRKGTAGAEGLLSVWGGVSGLLGNGASSEGTEGIVEARQERQALAPTIHNEASILLQMSNIEDEETRRVTEVAFM